MSLNHQACWIVPVPWKHLQIVPKALSKVIQKLMMGSINHGKYNPRSSRDENTRLDSTWVLCGEVESKREFFSWLDFITFLKNVPPKFLPKYFSSKYFWHKIFWVKILTQNFWAKIFEQNIFDWIFDPNVFPKIYWENFIKTYLHKIFSPKILLLSS